MSRAFPPAIRQMLREIERSVLECYKHVADAPLFGGVFEIQTVIGPVTVIFPSARLPTDSTDGA